MLNQFSRTQLLLGTEAMEKLKRARVAVFGIGGVGGYVCEALPTACSYCSTYCTCDVIITWGYVCNKWS